MNIYAKRGHKVVYLGASDSQVAWGQCDDPRGTLTEGEVYTVDHTEVHSWHTKVYLEGHEGKAFPSAAFDDYQGGSK
jgi:hypothetical protein